MARIAEARPPAAPVSKDQVARRENILDVAAELGARHGFDRVQMTEVARDAGVAIGTLYRYFPSKIHLFAAVWEEQVVTFIVREWPPAGDDPIAAVGTALASLSRRLLERPRLCAAMVQASAACYALESTDEAQRAETSIYEAILKTLGTRAPTEEDRTIVRLLVYSWWGVLVSSLSQKTSDAGAESELAVAARLLLAPFARSR